MNALFRIETINQKNTSGIKLYLFTFITLTFMENNYSGNHLSIGLGFVPLEVSMQFSIWKEMSYGQ